MSKIDLLASLAPETRKTFLAHLTAAELDALHSVWDFWARDDQRPPPGDWSTWVLLGGRGAGKTRAGAEWIRARIEGRAPLAGGMLSRVALVAQTYGDAREVMIEGPSGLRAIAGHGFSPIYEASRRRLVWPNGAVAQVFSAEDPERLRGPQFEGAWCDELGKWRYAQVTWDMLQMGLRLGPDPRQVVTTTPRPQATLKRILNDQNTVITKAATWVNRAFLAPAFFSRIVSAYEGTRLGRQELEADLLDDEGGGLWTHSTIDRARAERAPVLARIVVAVDPPASAGPDADECGIVVAGRAEDGHAYVLADRSAGRLSPNAWAKRSADAYESFKADRIVAEVNQGGDMVRAVLAQAAPGLPVRTVRATRGKQVRAEPIAALYEQGRVHHVGLFAALEDQLVDFATSSLTASPDRVDALVWALTDLLLDGEAGMPRVRTI